MITTRKAMRFNPQVIEKGGKKSLLFCLMKNTRQ